jgi:DNA-binding response OmpR family regulator
MILVCDDEHTLVQFCREILEKEGYTVRTARGADEAYRILREPDCRGMLLDMQMPEFNGAGLLLLMAGEGVQTPVILFADDPTLEEEEMRDFPNVRKLIHKPFYPEDLLKSVREFMPKA